jgi:HNH endonuclease
MDEAPFSVRESSASEQQSIGGASMSIRVLPSQQYLRECFTYDRVTGVLRWKIRPENHFVAPIGAARANGKHAGSVAGSIDGHGYYEIGIDGHSYRLHRIIWKLVTGVEPPETIDHTDGNRSNNAWSNLRPASEREQKWNMKTRIDNRSGYRGVSADRDKWCARINVCGTYQFLGNFATAEQASSVYEAVARKLHGEFYRRQR